MIIAAAIWSMGDGEVERWKVGWKKERSDGERERKQRGAKEEE